MTGTCLLLAVLLTAQASGEDLSFADNAAAADSPEAVAKAHLARTQKQVPAQERLSLAAGDTVFVTAVIPFKGPAPQRPRAVPVAVRADRNVGTAPWAEVLEIKGRRATVRYAVRSRPGPGGTFGLKFVLDLQDGLSAKTLGRIRVQHQLQVTPVPADAEALRKDRQAYLHHQAKATAAYRDLPQLKDFLRLDRVDRAPSASRVSDDQRKTLQAFLTHRLLADVAHVRIRAAAEHPDLTFAERAAQTLGSLSQRPTGPAASARAIEGVTAQIALQMTQRALDDLKIDIAEGFLNKLRTSGRLSPEQLAESLAMLGAISYLRKKPQDAIRAYGAALCLQPSLPDPSQHPILKARFQRAQAQPGCPEGLGIESVSAERKVGDEGISVQVRVRLKPDPNGIISGGTVQLWGSGGRVERSATPRVEVEDGVPYLVADLADDEDTRTTEHLLVTVFAKHLSGIVLASAGDPDPVFVAVAHAELGDAPLVPTWLWWAAGAVAVVGGATAGIWALSQQQGTVERGIGPVGVRF